MAGGLSSALAGLSAVYPAYREGMSEEYKLDDQKRAALARTALGSALAQLAQSQGGPAPQAPMVQPPSPGQPSQPAGGPGAAPPGGPGGMLQRPPMAGAPPGGMGGAPPGAPMPIAPQGMPPGGAPPQGMPQQGGGLPPGRQPLDWRQIVAAMKQTNPNLPPDVMAEAVNQFLPMMNAQSQQEWRQISLQLREQSLQQREQQVMMLEQGRNQRADLASSDRRAALDTRREEGQANRVSRETIAKMTVDERREAHEAGLISKEEMDAANRESREKIASGRLTEQSLARAGRERLQERRLDQQQSQFETRESRLQESLKLREDSTWQRLEQQKQQALQRAEAAQGRQGLAEVRAAIDAQDKHVRTRIQAYSANNSMKPAERKALLDQADMDYNEQIGRLRERFGRSTPTGGTSPEPPASKVPDRVPSAASPPAQSGAPVTVQTPEEAQKLPAGTRYRTPDGQEFVR
jgi:hypothetical protein